MTRPRLLLVPYVTELEWSILGLLEEWAEVATYDPPGVGEEPLPEGVALAPDLPEDEATAMFGVWRAATAERGLEEIERRGWKRCVLVSDGFAHATAIQIGERRPEAVAGIALGHAALSHGREGRRAPVNREIWEAMTALMRTDRDAFISYGIAQMTQGGVTEELAQRWLERIPNRDFVAGVWDVLGRHSEPIAGGLRSLDRPLLLAEHHGCQVHTEEGYEDIVAAFPEAATVSCPEACAASTEFADALRKFCAGIDAS
ncbi:MAG: hypothetical protein ACRDKX_00340 [Solirubrobacterales bacterium]